MQKTHLTHVATAIISILFLTTTVQATVGVRVIIENLAPADGTWLTPVWVGFHDGSFDTFNMQTAASEALERLAEDGNASPIFAAFELSSHGTVQGVIPADTGIPPIAPGETATMTFVVDNLDPDNAYFSYLAMVIPSNDAFIGNADPQTHRLFDGYGNFLGGFFTIYGTDVLDAGTEINDEIPEHTAFFGQTESDSGDDEFSVVHAHPGYLPPGSGGILDDPDFAMADFTAPGYRIARVIIVRSDTIVPSGTVSGTWDLEGSPYLLQGDVVVPYGQTLTIEPGVQVVSLCDCRMVIEGSLQAIGTEDAPILFTKDTTISEWHGLHFFYGSESSLLGYCIIEYGVADNTAPDDRGGGIYSEQSQLYLDHCMIRHNEAELGGGVYAQGGDLTVSHCQFSGNYAWDGGALVCEWSNVVLCDNDITENLAFGATGGGIYMYFCDALLLRNNISGNQAYASDYYDPAYANGGGVALSGDTVATLIGNRITNNLAHAEYEYGSTASGAGIWSSGGPDLTLINNTLANNVASASPDWNEKHGGGLYVLSGEVTINNDIYWNNTPQQISSLADYGLADITVSYSDVQGGEAEIELSPYHDLHWFAGNFDMDPEFVAPGAGDYRLQTGSPCIDTGDPDGFPDPDGSIADVGAYPFNEGLLGDLNGDSQIDIQDLAALLAEYSCATDCTADLDGDDDVDLADLAALLANYGAVAPQRGACCIMGQCVEVTEYDCARSDGVFHGPGTSCMDMACDYWEYENVTDFTVNWPKPGAYVSIADDLQLVGSGNRRLYYLSILVGAWEGQPYDCTAELWTDCPGGGGQPIPGTSHTWTDLPILQSSTLEAWYDEVEIPADVWIVVTFSSDYAGWFVADEAEVGYTTDFYGLELPPWSCTEVIPDSQYFRFYSGFWVRIRCH